VIVIQLAPPVAVHAQPLAAVTAIVPDPPPKGYDADVGFTVKVQAGATPASVTVTA
jgi:hypothetical protein